MKKYNRTYHLPWSKGTTNDDKKSDDIFNLLNNEIIITEKLDGENTAFVNDGVYARSHACFTDSSWSKEVRLLHDIKVRNNLEEDTYLFGENMEGIHSIKYNKLTSYFYLFGVRKNNIWLSWDKVEEYAFLLDLKTVPVLFKGNIETKQELIKITNSLSNESSTFGNKREGVVVRVYKSFDDSEFNKNLLKWVRKDHVQTDEHWTKNWKKANIIKNNHIYN